MELSFFLIIEGFSPFFGLSLPNKCLGGHFHFGGKGPNMFLML
jgi:hypothetical protein